MRSIYVPLLASMSLGCAASQTQVAHPLPQPMSTGDATAHRVRDEEQSRRITELEARLGLVEAEAREMRVLLQQREGARPDVIRIGAARAPQVDAEADTREAEPPDETESQRSRERRPLLRSMGEPPPVAARAPLALPMAPPGAPDRLPVAPLPSSAAAATQAVMQPFPPAPPIDSASVDERARQEYRAALTMVRNRDFDAALSALTEFLSKYPDQELTDRAMFWRAEAFYAKRDYERALAEFEALSVRFPRSEKVADAMLKIGMCHQRLGDEQRAQGFFRRVVEQFPASAAARAASKEGA